MYSTDVHLVAFRKLASGQSMRSVARTIYVSPSTVHRWMHSSWWGSKLKRKRHFHRLRRKRTTAVYDAAREYLKAHKNCIMPVRYLARHIYQSTSVSPSTTTCHRILKDLRFSRKRLSAKVLGRVSNEKVLDYVQRYEAVVKQDTIVVSVDECGFSEKVQPLYGYSRIGERCTLQSAKGNWTSRTLVLGISSDGEAFYRLKQGSMNRESFADFILDMPYPPGTVILMDNCRIHTKLEEVFEAKEYQPLFLSPYSPQFQPVELAFSKIKGLFRREWPWINGVESCLENILKNLSNDEIGGYFKHAHDNLRKVTAEMVHAEGVP